MNALWQFLNKFRNPMQRKAGIEIGADRLRRIDLNRQLEQQMKSSPEDFFGPGGPLQYKGSEKSISTMMDNDEPLEIFLSGAKRTPQEAAEMAVNPEALFQAKRMRGDKLVPGEIQDYVDPEREGMLYRYLQRMFGIK